MSDKAKIVVGDRVIVHRSTKGSVSAIDPNGHCVGRPEDTHLVLFDNGGFGWFPKDQLTRAA